MSFPNVISIDEAEVVNTYSSEVVPVGTLAYLPDGRAFRFAENGGTALDAGKLCQSVAVDTDLTGLAAGTIAAGQTVITGVDPLNTEAVTADQYKDGLIWVDTATGVGRVYRIKSNTANDGNGSTFSVTLYSPLSEAIAAADTVTIMKNEYRDVIVHPSPATSQLVGVPVVDVAADKFCWLQSKGPCSVLTEGTVVINEGVIDSASADGAVAPTASTAAGEENYVGIVMRVEATTQYSLINLKID